MVKHIGFQRCSTFALLLATAKCMAVSLACFSSSTTMCHCSFSYVVATCYSDVMFLLAVCARNIV